MRDWRYIPLVLLLGLLVACGGAALQRTETPTATPCPCPVATATPLPTLDTQPDPTATPEPTSTPEPPQSGTNLLVNGNFAQGFDGWQFVNGHWTVHRPISCEPTGTSYTQMDRDVAGLDDWPIGGEDWLWQDVAASESHGTVVFRMIEAHHMHEGLAEVTIYGQMDWDEPWEVVFHRPGVESPFGTGKCSFAGPPAAFEYVIPVEETYTAYRLEIHGHMVDAEDAFLFGGLELSVE